MPVITSPGLTVVLVQPFASIRLSARAIDEAHKHGLRAIAKSFANRSPDALRRTRAEWEGARRNVARLRAAGIDLVLGSDSGGDPSRTMGWHALHEVESLAAAGIPNAEVIVMSTRRAAEVLKLDRLGTLRSGKSADFIVLDAHPLENMTNIRKISSVYLRGQQVDRAAMRARWQAGWSRPSSK